MTVKELRDSLKGLNGNTEISTGNAVGYRPNPNSKNTLNLYLSCGSITKIDPMPIEKITNVILWMDE